MNNLHLCPKFEYAFTILGKRWNGLILKILMSGPKHFHEIEATLPKISDRILAIRFKELIADGLIVRKVYPETPVRIEYELTAMGYSLVPVMDAVQIWADEWLDSSDTVTFEHKDKVRVTSFV
ncbi:transcriptional regulator [Alicyclobacillaceae bacterium I2511]|nr:transcriptional regulator [Alicyclobacillaceae bacterium I2511]